MRTGRRCLTVPIRPGCPRVNTPPTPQDEQAPALVTVRAGRPSPAESPLAPFRAGRDGHGAVMLGIVEIVAVIAGLLLSFVWLVSEVASGWSAPGWVPAASVFSLAVAATITLVAGRRAG
jgi:hypothetical protein